MNKYRVILSATTSYFADVIAQDENQAGEMVLAMYLKGDNEFLNPLETTIKTVSTIDGEYGETR